jgi:hypothetical protein
MRYTEEDVVRDLVEYIRNEADLDDLAAMYSEHTSAKDDPVCVVVRGPKGPESDPYVNGKYADKEETSANARLIAAAPELLDGLKQILVKQQTGEGDFSVARLCLALIAKAEGRGE